MTVKHSYLVCTTPRSGSTLVCQALKATGVAGRPEEYFEALRKTGLWSRTAYDRYLEWAMEVGTTPNGVFAAKLMWGYFGDFIGLLRNVPRFRELRLAELLPADFPEVTFVRIVRANKIRQAVSLAADPQTSTLNLLERMGLDAPPDFRFEPRMKRQSDALNDDWARRYSELRLGTEFDLVPTMAEHAVPD